MFLVKLDPTGEVLWSKAYAAAEDSTQEVHAIATDAAGNVVLVGKSSDDVDLGNGPVTAQYDMVIVKLDGDGNHVFSAAYGTSNVVDSFSVAVDPTEQAIVVTGEFFGTMRFSDTEDVTNSSDNANFDAFLVRFAANGEPEEAESYGNSDNSDETPQSLATIGDDVYLSGSFGGQVNFGGDTLDSGDAFAAMFLAKVSGGRFAHEWSRQAGLGAERWAGKTRLAADTDGNLYIAG